MVKRAFSWGFILAAALVIGCPVNRNGDNDNNNVTMTEVELPE